MFLSSLTFALSLYNFFISPSPLFTAFRILFRMTLFPSKYANSVTRIRVWLVVSVRIIRGVTSGNKELCGLQAYRGDRERIRFYSVKSPSRVTSSHYKVLSFTLVISKILQIIIIQLPSSVELRRRGINIRRSEDSSSSSGECPLAT